MSARGCCTSCGGTGHSGDSATPGGACWDCQGTGHAHGQRPPAIDPDAALTSFEVEIMITRTIDCDALVATLERYGVPFRTRVAMMDNDGNATAWRVIITTRPA